MHKLACTATIQTWHCQPAKKLLEQRTSDEIMAGSVDGVRASCVSASTAASLGLSTSLTTSKKIMFPET